MSIYKETEKNCGFLKERLLEIYCFLHSATKMQEDVEASHGHRTLKLILDKNKIGPNRMYPTDHLQNLVNGPYGMNCNNLNDPITFHLAPSSGQTLNLSSTWIYDYIP